MRTNRWLALLGLSAAAVLVQPLPADAHPGEPPEDDTYICQIAFDVGMSCFEIAGDDQWVYDSTNNAPWNSRVQVETDYGKTRWCANTHGGGTWHECLFDHVEESCLRFRQYEQYGDDNRRTRNWSGWSPWVWVSTGDLCPL